MSADRIQYLNTGSNAPMYHRLVAMLEASPQKAAPAKQWASYISALTQKGVKQAEIDESSVLHFLQGHGDNRLKKEDVINATVENLVTVKEVALAVPKFANYCNFKNTPTARYKEYLYIANSEKDNYRDAIEQVRFSIEDLNFNMEALMEDPGLLDRLENSLIQMKNKMNKARDFTRHHYSLTVEGLNGRNLLFHVRVSEIDDIYFVEEIQSDWAQKGRRLGFSDNGAIPHGPYVENTESWAGLALRAHALKAAKNPHVKKFAWITGGIRNGGIGVSNDKLDDFYTKILPKIADKMLGRSGVKVSMTNIRCGNRTLNVPAFEMTDKAREVILAGQPMYSKMSLDSRLETPDEKKNEVLRSCEGMLGSAAQVRMVSRLYDISTGARVAGRYANNVVTLSLEAKDLKHSGDHEVFHAAYDLMMGDYERQMIHEAFEPGSQLNYKVKDILIRRGEAKAAAQCEDAEEAAAHGFALWRSGDLDVREQKVAGIFGTIVETMKAFNRWVREKVLGDGHQTPQDLFEALANDSLAARHSIKLMASGV